MFLYMRTQFAMPADSAALRIGSDFFRLRREYADRLGVHPCERAKMRFAAMPLEHHLFRDAACL